jgi:hypothetical protein
VTGALEASFDTIDLALQIGGETIDLTETVPSNIGFNGINSTVTRLPASPQLPRNCGEMLINQSLYNLEGEWTLTIESLGRRMGGIATNFGEEMTTLHYYPSADYLPTLEAALRALLPEAELTPIPASNFQPEGIRVSLSTEQATARYIELDALLMQEVVGQWTFRFTPS